MVHQPVILRLTHHPVYGSPIIPVLHSPQRFLLTADPDGSGCGLLAEG
jgi:hypothetical protein